MRFVYAATIIVHVVICYMTIEVIALVYLFIIRLFSIVMWVSLFIMTPRLMSRVGCRFMRRLIGGWLWERLPFGAISNTSIRILTCVIISCRDVGRGWFGLFNLVSIGVRVIPSLLSKWMFASRQDPGWMRLKICSVKWLLTLSRRVPLPSILNL